MNTQTTCILSFRSNSFYEKSRTFRLYQPNAIRTFIYILAACIFCHYSATAQTLGSTNYHQKDGLPSDNVYDMCVDREGFIWFATESGLSRFDGTKFKNYTTRNGLPDNLVLRVTPSRHGGVWLKTIQNIPYLFNHDSIVRPFASEEMLGPKRIILEEVIEDKGGNEYLGLVDDVLKVSPDGKLERLSATVKNFPTVPFVFSINRGRMVLSTADLFLYLIEGNECKKLYPTLPYAILTDWEASTGPVYYKFKTEQTTAGQITDDLMYSIIDDTLLFLNPRTAKEIFRVSQKKVTSATQDADGNLWVSTEGYGVFKFPSINIRNFADPSTTEVFSLTEYNGRLWMGVDSSTVIAVKDNFKGIEKINFNGFINNTTNHSRRALTHNRIYTFGKGDSGHLFIGSDAFLLCLTGTGKILAKGYAPVKTLTAAGDELLMGTGSNAVLLDNKDLQSIDTLNRSRTVASAYANGKYYVGTTNGMLIFDATTHKLIKNENKPPLNKRLVSIQKDNNGQLFIATADQGLVKYTDTGIEKITTADGLLSEICTSLFIDSKNEIWLGTDKGLNHIRFSDKKMHIETFTKEDGLIANMINAIVANDSMVYVGTPAGLSYFNRQLIPTTSVCRLYVENVYRDTTKLSIDSTYTFPYNATNIRFEYGVISFRSAGNISYQYMLQGLETDWHSSKTPVLVFPSLAPGDYQLIMKATNRYGVESDEIKINIHILPPWWKTTWFMITAGILLVCAVVLIYDNRIRQIKKQETARRNTQYQLSLLEQQALQSQMNPHFVFNCLNSIQQYIFTDNKVAANLYLTQFASLIRQTLDNSSKKTISVSEEIEYLKKYLEMEKVRFGDNFTYHVTIGENVQTDLIEIPPMLLQPYVENCLRHGLAHKKDGRGIITISFENHEDALWCRIKDNGVGRAKANQLKSTSHIEYQSKGMSLTQKRIDLLNKNDADPITVEVLDITDSYGQVAGTEVIVKFPVNT